MSSFVWFAWSDGCEARGQDRADTLVYRNHTTSTLRTHYSYYSLLSVSRADFSDHLRGLFVLFLVDKSQTDFDYITSTRMSTRNYILQASSYTKFDL